MYQKISKLPEDELKKIREIGKSLGIILSEPSSYDFEKVVCNNGKKPFTKENLIEELSKIDLLPDYTLLLDIRGNIHLIPISTTISDNHIEEMYYIFKNIFGIVECG